VRGEDAWLDGPGGPGEGVEGAEARLALDGSADAVSREDDDGAKFVVIGGCSLREGGGRG